METAMRNYLKYTLITWVLFLSAATATTLHVPGDYPSIQVALTAAQSGDTVLVQPGTYPENIFWPDVNGIRLISAGDSSNTIIDGGGNNSSVIYMNPATATLDSTTEIQGFKITNGGNIANGGGMFFINASPVLTRLWVTGNTATTNGGGLYISGGSPTLINVSVTGNTAYEGGGLFIYNSSPTLSYVTVTGNTASSGNGGGLYISGGSPALTNVTVTGNTATANGGGFYIYSGTTTLTDVTVSDNTASNQGGGLYILSSNATLTNVTVTGNKGRGLFIREGSPILTNVAVTGNTGGGLYIYNSSPTLTGVTVTGNTATSNGGGLCISGGSSPILTNVAVTGNTAGSGGGLYISADPSGPTSSPTLSDVTVTNNTATTNGGGLSIYNSSPTLSDVTVTNNTATANGGGLYIKYGEDIPTLTDVIVSGNAAYTNGGGLSISGCSPTLMDAIVSGNVASSGGGLYISGGSPALTRVTVSRNLGAGLYFSSGSGALVNVTITGNTRGIYVESGTPTIAGSNIAYHGTGLHNADNTNTVDADSVWWGDSSGPYHPQHNPGGLGDSVNAYVDITPFLTEPDTAAPPIPVQNLVVTNQGDDFIELAWEASPIGDLAGYKIYLNTDSTGFPYTDTVVVGNATAYTLSSLEPGLTYYVAATCYDTDGNESWYSREVAATVSPVPRIAVSSSTIDFDATMVGATAEASLQVSNTGTADLSVSQILCGDPQFVASPGSFTVPVGGQQDVTVSFIPTAYGLVADTLTIISDAYNDQELPVLVQGFGDLPEAPVILSIVDVDDPPDQGGQVRVNFARSKYDGLDISQAIASYSVWRHIEADEWDAIGRFDAVQDSIYHYVAPTLCDSTWEGICWSIFKVSAHTDDPDTFYFSQPDSGYSIDNIAPGMPTGLLAAETDNGVVLSWHPSTETDFQYYAIYRSTQPGFDPDTAEAFLFSTADTHYVDADVQVSTTYYYRISAFDYAGNESGFSDEVSITILGVSREYGIPAEYALHPGYPNPFNPSITLPFDLPEGTPVSLVVYDIMGREVVRLVESHREAGYHRIVWDGRDSRGRAAPTGLYIARMVTPGYTRSIKLVLLK